MAAVGSTGTSNTLQGPRGIRDSRTHTVPPQNMDAERAVLGAILIDTEKIHIVAAIIQALDFYHPGNAMIFEAMQVLAKRGDPIDTVTLTGALKERDRLNSIGGIEYLVELSEYCPSASNIDHYAKIVAEMAQARRMIIAAQTVVTRGFENLGEVEDFLDDASMRVTAAAQRRMTNRSVSLEAALKESFEALDRQMLCHGQIVGVSSGFKDLDEVTAGLHPGQFSLIAGRPSMGKTAFALCLAVNVARASRKPVLFLSLEMPRTELANRLLCAEAKVNQSLLRANLLTEEHMVSFTEAASRIYSLPLYIDDSGEMTLMDLRAKARRMKAEGDLSLIVIDYLQLMRASRSTFENREQEISEISRGLKRIAKELSVPVVALSQLNRQLEGRVDKRPMLSDLRESGSLEQDADVVMFVYRDDVYDRASVDKGLAEIIVGKQRNGPTGTVRLQFLREYTTFLDLPSLQDGDSRYNRR